MSEFLFRIIPEDDPPAFVVETTFECRRDLVQSAHSSLS